MENWDWIGQPDFYGQRPVKKDGLYGILNKKGDLCISCRWDAVKPDFKYHHVCLSGKWGLINENEELLIPCRYDETGHFYGSIAPVRIGEKWAIIGRDGTELTLPLYDGYIGSYNLIAVRLGSKWGAIGPDGTQVVPFQWDTAPRSDGKGIIVSREGKLGLLNEEGNPVLPCAYDQILVRSAVWVCKDKKWGLYTLDGRQLTDFVLDMFGDFNPPYYIARVMQNGLYGYLRIDGTWVSPCIWQEAHPSIQMGAARLGGTQAKYDTVSGRLRLQPDDKLFGELCVIPMNGKFRLFDPEFAQLGEYDRLLPYRNTYGHILAKKDGKFGVLDAAGNELLPLLYDEVTFGTEDILLYRDGIWRCYLCETNRFLPGEYEEAEHFLGTHARVKKGGVWGLTDQHGHFREGSWTDYGARAVIEMSEGMTLMEYEGRLGLADRNGNLVTPCIWEDVGICQEGAIAVKLFGSWGFVDRQGRQTESCRWEKVRPFSKGLARVFHRGVWHTINKDGEIFSHSKYHEGMASALQNGLWGYVDNRGKIVHPFQWDKAGDFKDGFAEVWKDGTRFTVSK